MSSSSWQPFHPSFEFAESSSWRPLIPMKCLSVGSVASHSCYRVQWSVAATWKHRISLWNLEEPDQMDWNTIRSLLESVGIEVLCLYLMKPVATEFG